MPKYKGRVKMAVLKNNLFMLAYVWKYKKSMLFFKLLIASLGATYTFIDIYFIKWMFDALDSKETVVFLFSIIGFAGLIHLFIGFANSMYNNLLQPKLSLSVSEKINDEMIDKAQSIDLACYENAEFFDKYTRALSETNQRVNGVLNTFSGIISAILNITVIVSLIATIDIIFVIFGLLASFIVFTQGLIFNKISFKENQEKTPFNRQQGYVRRVIYQTEYAKEVKLYQPITLLFKDLFRKGKNGLIDITEKYGNKKTVLSCIFAIIQLAFESILPWIFIAIRTFAGIITIGDAAAIFNATNQLPYALNSLFNVIPQMHQHSLYIDNLREILNYQSQIENSKSQIDIPKHFDKISFDDVSFSYFGSENNVLKNVSFNFSQNQKIAIVGTNGSGKTTLIKLLTRLYDPIKGKITVDGRDIKQFDVHKYRQMFGLCFQDYRIYAMTIKENILMRKSVDERDIEKIENVLKQVGLYEKIRSLPNYLDTMLTREFDNSGVFLSGGETQKLVLARALVSDAQVLVLDEPSSALDPIAEYEINKIILETVKDKTVILISHRLSSTVDADMIYYMKDGIISEQGNHSALIALNGEYANMFNIQAKKYRSKNVN